MKINGIIFSTEEVIALKEGHKSQIRKVILPYPDDFIDGVPIKTKIVRGHAGKYEINCVYGGIGDVLYVEETWCNVRGCVVYRADHLDDFKLYEYPDKQGSPTQWPWYSSATMREWASRFKLKITNRYIERLLDITDTAAMYEGWQCDPNNLDYLPRQWYLDTWQKNKGRTIPVASNPYVWVIEFEKINDAVI